MALALNGDEVLVYLAAVLMLALGVVVLRTRPERAQNRWFVGVLAAEFVMAVAGASTAVTTSLDVAYAASVVFLIGLSFSFPVYLGFLSTLDTRISRALRSPVGRTLPWIVPIAALTLLTFQRSLVIASPDPTAADVWATVGGPLFPPFQMLGLAGYLLGLITVLTYWRTRQMDTLARRQGAVFALAFGIHDGGMVVSVGTHLVANAVGVADNFIVHTIAYYGLPVVKLVLLSLVTYGILRLQLFDLDVKVKWTLGRGTALAILAGVFSLVKETLEYALPGEGLLANIAGAIAIGVLARPAWKLGTHLADRLLPEVEPTEAFLGPRRLEVFRASLSAVAADGKITSRERKILDTMCAELGILPSDAQRIEEDVLAAARRSLTNALPPAPASDAPITQGPGA